MKDIEPDDAVKISIRNLYKIFGDDPQGALEKVRAGVDKPTLFAEHGHVLGLNDVNIDIRAGRITVVMGLSGSGKSTLIRHLNRLIEPTAGEIALDGEDVLTYSPAALRRLRRERMSMVFQKFALLPHRTVLENAATALAVRGLSRADQIAEATRWLDRVGLEGYGDSHPHELSGGMQQRVGIARALTSNAEIMLMDEAFSALDPLIRTDMQGLLLDIQRELAKTIVFITHDLDEALRLADHLVILKDGCVVQQGEPQQILLHPADHYVASFIADVNRARVLRARSVMRAEEPTSADDPPADDAVDADATLEDVICRAGGDATRRFRVTRGAETVGVLHMSDLVRALVRRDPAPES